MYYHSTIAKVWLSDLFQAVPILEPRDASSPRGRIPRDPLAMLRSLLVMYLEGYISITKWVKAIKPRPILAIICGFEPGDTPGIKK